MLAWRLLCVLWGGRTFWCLPRQLFGTCSQNRRVPPHPLCPPGIIPPKALFTSVFPWVHRSGAFLSGFDVVRGGGGGQPRGSSAFCCRWGICVLAAISKGVGGCKCTENIVDRHQSRKPQISILSSKQLEVFEVLFGGYSSKPLCQRGIFIIKKKKKVSSCPSGWAE